MKKLAILMLALSLTACANMPPPTVQPAYTFQSTTQTQERADADKLHCEWHLSSKKQANCLAKRGYKLVAVNQAPDAIHEGR